ncbi:MAG: ATP-binding protein [Legionella sp.]|nr:ATP-binding protein [Legionella sp.]
MFINRILNLKQLIDKKSHFLFGPRATGKSSLIKHDLGIEALVIDLLHSETYMRLMANPSLIESMIELHEKAYVVIDEIQRVPELLNEVHRLIENKKIRFLLTGSSARKLRRHGINLLAGRARQAELFPLSYHEFTRFNLPRYLQYGGLPMVVLSDEPEEDLDAYVYTYLEQEIKAEALVKNLPAFSRFLQLSALTSGTTLNFTSIANDAGVSSVTLREYYQILEDSFLGFSVLPWRHSVKRKAIATARFYYFDTGVKNRLAGIHAIPEKTDVFGQAFEHFIAMELRAYLSYFRKKLPLCFWRTSDGHEVDFVIGDQIAIEVKSTDKISSKHLKGLRYLMEENKLKQYYMVSQDSIARKEEGIYIFPWEDFLKRLWNEEII